MKTRDELDAALNHLAEVVAKRVSATDSAGTLEQEFAAIVDDLYVQAGPEHSAYVRSRFRCILRDAGLLPGDEPCSE